MISKRLRIITSYICEDDNVLDVGTDHALLPIYLVKNKLCKKVIASDININALNSAKNNISKYNLEKKIKIFLSDGISSIDLIKHKINTLVISGMGAKTILKILESSKIKQINKLIIQSNNDHFLLREEITKKGFIIADETITFDSGKYYITIFFVRGQNKTNIDFFWGMIKPENLNYYNHLKNNYLNIYKKIPKRKIVLRFKTKSLINKLNKIIKTCYKK